MSCKPFLPYVDDNIGLCGQDIAMRIVSIVVEILWSRVSDFMAQFYKVNMVI